MGSESREMDFFVEIYVGDTENGDDRDEIDSSVGFEDNLDKKSEVIATEMEVAEEAYAHSFKQEKETSSTFDELEEQIWKLLIWSGRKANTLPFLGIILLAIQLKQPMISKVVLLMAMTILVSPKKPFSNVNISTRDLQMKGWKNSLVLILKARVRIWERMIPC